MPSPVYQPRREMHGDSIPVRGGHYQTWRWHGSEPITRERPLLVLMHGWMDVGASFQFVADALDGARHLVAADWRGFGHSMMGQADSYWFPNYVGDLDALIDSLSPDAAVDLLGHSMGGNIVMSYAAARPARIRKLVNLEGFGMPATRAQDAPRRMRQWLDELKQPQRLRDYASVADVAQRLMENHPRLTPDKAAWLAPRWAEPRADGRWHVLGDAAHKRVNPILARREEQIQTWLAIEAPVLWIEGRQTDMAKWWGDRYPRSDFEERLAVVRALERHTIDECGHMMHLDQPQAVAERIDSFLDQ